MLNNEQIIELVNGLPIRSYKHAVTKEPMKLSKHQADALGSKNRNILRVVKTAIQAIADKLFIDRITSDSDAVTVVVEQWFTKNRGEVLQRDLYKLVVRDGLAYVQVKYEGDTPTLSIIESYDGRTGAVSLYDPQTKKEVAVLNLWYAGNTRNLDIYYDSSIEKYEFDNDNGVWSIRRDLPNEQWPIDWTDTNGNPLGIALVRFDIGESDIVEAVQLQSDINDVVLDLLATSKTMGWPQRVLKNASQETFLMNEYNQPLIDSFGTNYPIPRKIELTPGSILMLNGADSSLEQLPQATVDTQVLDVLRSLMSDATTVPQYVFTGGDFPSGVALLNAETRLNHKCEAHASHLTPSFESMFSLMLRLSNTFGNTAYDTAVVVTVLFTSPEVWTVDLQMELQRERSNNAALLKNSGILSVEDALRMVFTDKNDDEIAAMVARVNAENTGAIL
jgi:hypothetical protein